MTQPMKYEHDAISCKPTLYSCKGGNRNPYRQVVTPIDFGHLNLLPLHSTTTIG